MSFLAPERLWLLLAVAALGLVYVVLQRRRRHYAVRFTNLALLDSVAPRRPGWRRHVVAVIAGLSLCALVIGLARPARDTKVPRDEAVVMLAIDVSRSMLADDVSPSRMASAIAAAEDFIDDIPSRFRVGLVAFDDESRILATPTLEHQVVIDALGRLEPGQGTAAGDGIESALEAIESTLGTGEEVDDFAATIVLLSDGATTSGTDPIDAAEEAADAGVPVTTIAYGTDAGVVEVDGDVIPVPADPVTMEAIADTTDGTFFEAATAAQLRAVYEDIQGRVGFTVEQREVVLWFLTAGAIALVLALLSSMVWQARFL
jgi:Ca-activated chloride channel family protein